MCNTKCECDVPRLRFEKRIASRGRWYAVYFCNKCKRRKVQFDREVDQGNLRDCEAADASQGIV